jgi:hypothetical protein
MDYPLEATFDIKFNTRTTADPPALITFAGTPAVEIYEDNSTTQITGAATLTVDFDGITGLHNLRIAATAANGFEAGKSYSVVISSGTVDGNSVVGETLFNFTIGRSAAKATADSIETKVDTIDGIVDSIDTGVNNIEIDTATLIAALAVVDGNVDAVKTKTDIMTFNGSLLTVDVKAWDEMTLDSTDPFDSVALESSLQTALTNQVAISNQITVVDNEVGDIAVAVAEVDTDVNTLLTQCGRIEDYSAYGLTILSGAINNAQTSIEEFVKTLNGTQYTVSFAGLDTDGNRTGSTLTKV